MASIHAMGFDEALVESALVHAGGNQELAINFLLNDALKCPAPHSAVSAPSDRADQVQPFSRISPAFHPFPPQADSHRFYVVTNPEVESSNNADVYVHGLVNGWQAHSTSGALFPNGSDMWLGKFELGKAAILSCAV
jgi:hypothetical protein